MVNTRLMYPVRTSGVDDSEITILSLVQPFGVEAFGGKPRRPVTPVDARSHDRLPSAVGEQFQTPHRLCGVPRMSANSRRLNFAFLSRLCCLGEAPVADAVAQYRGSRQGVIISGIPFEGSDSEWAYQSGLMSLIWTMGRRQSSEEETGRHPKTSAGSCCGTRSNTGETPRQQKRSGFSKDGIRGVAYGIRQQEPTPHTQK
ncbi:hypothetical protein V8F33_006123 [Rhypophila sp. PSN 637]